MNVIFFNTIALGDYLVHSRLIKNFKKKYNCNITAVCSPYNSKIISKQKHIDDIILYDKNWSITKKLKCLKKILSKKFYLSIVFDCQKFSMLANFFLKSKFKRGVITSKYKTFFCKKIYFYYPSKLISFFLYDDFVIHPKRKYLEKNYYLPKTWINLLKDFKTETNFKNIYYFNPNKAEENKKNKILKKLKVRKYVLFHFDYKWVDLKNINSHLLSNLIFFQKKINATLILTSFNNKSYYFSQLKKNISTINSTSLKINKKNNLKIFHIENPNIFLQERLIASSNLNISCHSGIVVHGSGANNKKIIDILNYEEIKYQRCWAPLKNYFIVKKSFPKSQNSINSVFSEILRVRSKI